MKEIYNLRLIFLATLLACSCSFMIQEQSPTFENEPSAAIDTMNNITTDEWTNISRLIIESESLYLATQLNQRAQYIFNGMMKYSYNSWNMYIFAGKIDDISLNIWPLQNKYFWKIGFGKYNHTYVGFLYTACTQKGSGGASVPFGQSVSTADQQRITQLVKNSIIYRGDNMQGAGQYLKNQFANTYREFWTVLITTPTLPMGYYECRFQQYWANLKQFGDFKWNYYLSKLR